MAEEIKLRWTGPEAIRPALLETFLYEGERQRITYTTREFSAVCPFSGLPDIATVTIEYVPASRCLELRSLKYYFLSYRDVGIYQEHATERIFQDVRRALSPAWLKVTTLYNTRGGIDATCVVESGPPPAH